MNQISPKEIKERNLEIAFYAGWVEYKPQYRGFIPFFRKKEMTYRRGWIKNRFSIFDLEVFADFFDYDKDWDSLMKIVDLIESEKKFCVYIHSNCCSIQSIRERTGHYFCEQYGKTKQEAVFLAVSDFAKYMNIN